MTDEAMDLTALTEKTEELLGEVDQAGYLTREELHAAWPELTHEPELEAQVRKILAEAGVSILEGEGEEMTAEAELEPFSGGAHLTAEAVDDGDVTGAYLSQLGKVPLLDREEEIELAQRMERGIAARKQLAGGIRSSEKRKELQSVIEDGLAAREHLILANSRLVISVAKKYMGNGIPFRDLIQEGHIGLMRAVKKFDHRRGFKFSTYATWWIRQAISRALADQGRTIRIPVHMVERIRKMLKTRHRLTQTLGRPPTAEELAKPLETDASAVTKMLQYSWRTASLDVPIGDDGDTELSEIIVDDEAPMPEERAAESSMEQATHRALEELDVREARILRLRNGIPRGKPLSLQEIGELIGVTRERVRQIEARALRKLRRSKHRRHLREHLTGL